MEIRNRSVLITGASQGVGEILQKMKLDIGQVCLIMCGSLLKGAESNHVDMLHVV